MSRESFLTDAAWPSALSLRRGRTSQASSRVFQCRSQERPQRTNARFFAPDVLVFRDGRIKLPADPNRITSTR